MSDSMTDQPASHQNDLLSSAQVESLSEKPATVQQTPPNPVRPTHGRSQSVATSSPHTRKRLSLSFPVLPPNHSPASRNSPITPASGACTPPELSRITPDDPASFLTALAAQERRVLELREELAKAESELGRMKKQWTLHEASRNRHEPSLNITSPTRADSPLKDLASPTSRSDYERLRNSRGNSGGSRRKVLPSQRHQRTLSLLSPKQQGQSFPQPDDVDSKEATAPPPLSKRHTIMEPPTRRPEPSGGSSSSRPHSLDILADFPGRQDVILQTGKQIADDLKEGLWSFLEDLKQATVGDDIQRAKGHNNSSARPNQPRRVPSKNSVKGSSSGGKSSSATISKKPAREVSKKGKEKAKEPEPLIDFGQDDTDDDRESRTSSKGERELGHSHRWSTSTTLSDFQDGGVMTPPSKISTPRTSTSSTASQLNFLRQYSEHGAQSPVWNAISSSTTFLTQAQLKKHANALMSQVEKSLSIESPSSSSSQPHRPSSTGCNYNADERGELRSRPASPVKAESQRG